MTAPIIQLKRGASANLPGLRAGEPGFTTDKYDLYVGLNSTTEDNQFIGSGRYWEQEDGTESLSLKLVDKDGQNSINIKSPDTLTGVTTYTFPALPEQDKVLSTDDDGNLFWKDGGGGSGEQIVLGNPTDGSYSDGAIGISSDTKVVDSIDSLNELALNMLKGTAVSDVDFSADKTAGGSPLTVTLTPTVAGNADAYEVDWGDGTVDSSLTHTYVDATGGQFDVSLTASNSGAILNSAGSESTAEKLDYITLYTPDPSVDFEAYTVASGGSPLSDTGLYVVEGQTLHIENTTTNTENADVTYTMDWGDGNTSSIADDSSAGGVSGSRLDHTWADGSNSGTGMDTMELELSSHTTADPDILPVFVQVPIKVYDDAPATPDGLDSKTLTEIPSVGESPKLAFDFSDNTTGTTLSAGSSVNRVTSGTVESTAIDSFAYGGDSGTLSASINGSVDGSVNFTESGDESGTYDSLVVTEESDYQLLDSSGSPTTFESSIYYPGLYKGFKSKISKTVSDLLEGVNDLQLQHSSEGSTNVVEFVKDDLTAKPSTGVASASITETTANLRYISGIPHYDSGSELSLSGVKISNLVGQCYTDRTDIVEVQSSEGIVDNLEYSYSDIDGATSMLAGGIPKSDTGVGGPYSLGSLTVPITSGNVRSEGQLKVRAKNVNGVGNFSNTISKLLNVHTAEQSGVSEIAIPVEDSLGDGSFLDDGIRIFNFSLTSDANPSYVSINPIDFYTNDVFSESSDPGIEGTSEASIRFGEIVHDVNDYSDYLPAGPDRSLDTGTQYFTFAFRRKVVANFEINITSSGISGIWIAAPGTNIDNTSNLNGWLDCNIPYEGAGIPGSNTSVPYASGTDGCAFNISDLIAPNVSLSGSYTMTLGEENMSNATGNVVLVRIALTSGQSISSLSITEASV